MKIAHFADVHFRGLARHDEYRRSFEDAFESLKKIKPDLIYIGGDIVHSKTQGISPELIDILTWWFTSLQAIAPTYVILGNHDGLIFNVHRQDAISPIIKAIDSDRIFLMKQSGVYDCIDPKFKLCVFSLFDRNTWKDVKPAAGHINIALYHGSVRGATSDLDYELEGEESVSFFEKYHFTLLGDIHKRQFLNPTRTIGYCGSTIQQNYGESADKGFLLWDIKDQIDFDVRFIPVKNDRQHHTILWNGDLQNDIKQIESIPKNSRIRIDVKSSDVYGLKQFQTSIENKISPSEFTFKSEQSKQKDDIKKITSNRINTRKIFEDFVKQRTSSSDVSQKCMQKIDQISQAFGRIDRQRNVKWDLNKLEFSNLFAYGEDNSIDFEKLPGITGIFGKNRSGKSSIIGSIVYALFNTTDRGSLKNLHVINAKKDTCSAKAVIKIGQDSYSILRETKKNFPKKADVWASTTLSITKNELDAENTDLNDEQRRETEKVLRSLIGTADDFFYTCLAAQGQMNSFILEKSSARKQMLGRFLDIDYFEELNDAVKLESAQYRQKIKSIGQNIDFETQIKTLQSDIALESNKKSKLKQKLSDFRSDLLKYSQDAGVEFITQDQLNICTNDVAKLDENTKLIEAQISEAELKIKNLTEKIERANNAILLVSLSDLKKEQSDINDLTSRVQVQKRDIAASKREIDIANKSIELLTRVPCEGKFPTCEFICDAHKDKQNLNSHKSIYSDKSRDLDIMSKRIDEISLSNPSAKIIKYQQIYDLEKSMVLAVKELEGHNRVLDSRLKNSQDELNKKIDELARLNQKFDISKATEAKTVIKIKKDIESSESGLMSIATQEGKLQERLENAIKTRDEILTAIQEICVYDIVEDAFSKKGVPLNIINESLPIINSEISRLLDGIAGFNIEISSDDSSIEIYIDYGDSRRLIELCSGMEKLIASIVIRVALTNISELPKPSMFIIDEGFGSLDDSNIESCARLINNLKNEFRNIIIISHVDAVKDIVDNVIDIEWRNDCAAIQC